MKQKAFIAFGIIVLTTVLPVCSQPSSRAAQADNRSANSELSVRAQTRYPGASEVPTDVMWTREIYRTLDLTQGDNGALYYPVEPMGDRMNLFSLIFKLLATRQIPVYEYQLDGVERFTPDKEVNLKDVLDRFGIYYEQKKLKNRKDSVLMVDNSDVPSADVLSYFIKEVWFYDHRTSSFGSKITAICPVLHRAEDFSMDRVKLPMFWVNYQDLATHLSNAPVMASDYNHATNSSMNDYFTTKRYKGDIYKTTNLRNLALAQYCDTDSALVNEQQRIEGELVQFERNLYGPDLIAAEKAAAEKAAAAANPAPAKKSAKAKTATATEGDAVEATPTQEVEISQPKVNSKKKGRDSSVRQSSSSSRSSGSSAPKASVRRERR